MATHRRLVPKDGADFYRLKVVRQDTTRTGRRKYWICRCLCGKSVTIRDDHLRSGHTKSCGCLTYKHGATIGGKKHPMYEVWRNMRRRCFDPKNLAYADYGGRGITVCKEWRDSYEAFRDYMLALPGCPKNIQKPGFKSDKEIDRKDNDGNYEPGNVKWSNAQAQSRNRRSNIIITVRNKKLCLTDYANMCCIPVHMFQNRIKRGCSISDALNQLTPVIFRFSRRYERVRAW